MTPACGFAGRALGRVYPLRGEYPRGENFGSQWAPGTEMPPCPAWHRGTGRAWAPPQHRRWGGRRSRFTSSNSLFQAISLQWIPALVMQRSWHVTAPGKLSIKRKPRWSQGRAGRLPAAPGSAGGGSRHRHPRGARGWERGTATPGSAVLPSGGSRGHPKDGVLARPWIVPGEFPPCRRQSPHTWGTAEGP